MTARKLSLTIVLCAVALTLASCACNPSDTVGADDPFVLIEKERWGLIENVYSKEVGISNTEALNLAMNTMLSEGHTKLMLETGDYCVWGANDEESPSNFINIPSNVHLDLNGSTLRIAKHDKPSSSVIRVYNQENIKISNGRLIGSRDDHNYGESIGPNMYRYAGTDHQYGMGIWIWGRNVEVYNMTVTATTGDGIYVGYASENVRIRNNTVSRARRGGIVLTDANGVKIHDNHVFDIYNDQQHFDDDGAPKSIGEEACIAIEGFIPSGGNEPYYINDVQIYKNTLIGTDGDYVGSSHENVSSRLNWTISLSWGTNGVTIRDNDLTGGFRIATGNNILFEKNTLRNKRAQDASGYGRFMATYAVDARTQWRNSENVVIRNNKFYDITLMINGGTLSESRPDYRKNYAIVGNEFTMISNWRAPVHINSTVNTAVIDNKFFVDAANWKDEWYNPTVGRRPEAYCFISINARTPPLREAGYNFYIANNTVDNNTEHTYMKVYWLPDHYDHNYEGYGLEDDVSPAHPGLPDWYRESNDRAEAMAFINSWKWF